MGAVEWIEEKAGAAYDAAAETANDVYEGGAEIASDVGDTISEGVDYVGEKAGEVGDAIGEGVDYVGEKIGDGVDYVTEGISDGVDWAEGKIDEAGTWIDQKVDEVKEYVDETTSDSGLGSKVDEMMEKSPTLAKNLEDVKAKGYTIRYGKAGEGTFCDSEKKEIVVDPSSKGDTEGLVQSLAHETGHALYTMDAEVPMAGLTREEYVKQNTMRHLKDEGEATITNIKIREEIMKAGGNDIGVAGSKSKEYIELAKKYPDPKDRDKLREEIGKVFAKGETPSTDLSSNYEDYYGQGYKDHWDKNHP